MGRRQITGAAAMIMALSLAFTACDGGGDDAAPPADSTGDTGSVVASVADPPGDAVDDPTDDTGAPAGEDEESSEVFDPFLGDLPQPCTVISADEIGGIVGTAVTVDDTFSTDCIYEPTDVAAGGLTVHTSTLSFGDECSEFIQTEPFVPQESVEPAPEYGDLAALVTSDGTSQYQVCADGVAFSVGVLGLFESDDELRAIAAEILDLLMERS